MGRDRCTAAWKQPPGSSPPAVLAGGGHHVDGVPQFARTGEAALRVRRGGRSLGGRPFSDGPAGTGAHNERREPHATAGRGKERLESADGTERRPRP